MAATDFIGSLPGWELVLFFALVIIFVIASAVTIFVIMSRLRWPFRFVVTEDVAGSGNQSITKRGRCRLIAFGDGGEEIFYLKGMKKYRIGYGKRIGPKQLLWSVGSDGYWYNSTFGNLDQKLQELGVVPVDRDMRFAMASMRKGIENRYNEKSWMDKYGPLLYFGLFIITLIIFGVIMWFAFDKQSEIAGTNAQTLETTVELQETQNQILSSLDNILSRFTVGEDELILGGSGITPVT